MGDAGLQSSAWLREHGNSAIAAEACASLYSRQSFSAVKGDFCKTHWNAFIHLKASEPALADRRAHRVKDRMEYLGGSPDPYSKFLIARPV